MACWKAQLHSFTFSACSSKPSNGEILSLEKNGIGIGPEAEHLAAQQMKNKEFNVTVELNQGGYEDYYITSDLTHDYVSINADYRS